MCSKVVSKKEVGLLQQKIQLPLKFVLHPDNGSIYLQSDR